MLAHRVIMGSFRMKVLSYYGTVTSLSVARSNMATATVGNYALFGGGGTDYPDYKSTVDAYNTSLTRSTPTALSVGRNALAAASIGNYALFGGGAVSTSPKDTVDVYQYK